MEQALALSLSPSRPLTHMCAFAHARTSQSTRLMEETNQCARLLITLKVTLARGTTASTLNRCPPPMQSQVEKLPKEKSKGLLDTMQSAWQALLVLFGIFIFAHFSLPHRDEPSHQRMSATK